MRDDPHPPGPHPGTSPVSVAILAGVRLYGEGLALLLKQSPQLVVLGDFTSDHDGLRAVAALSPDVALLESRFVCESSAVADLARATPRTRVVAFGVAAEADDGLRCAEAGAAGYASADAPTAELIATIVGAAAGEFRCSPRFAALLVERVATLVGRAPERVGTHARLTPREQQVAVLVDEGMSNKEIASHLGIGLSTVKNHIHHLLEKLSVQRRSQAAVQVRRARTRT